MEDVFKVLKVTQKTIILPENHESQIVLPEQILLGKIQDYIKDRKCNHSFQNKVAGRPIATWWVTVAM
jgi:hypothetical protein